MRHDVDRIDRGGHGQSWDVLAGGETLGPVHFEHGSWDQLWRWPNFKPEELACKGTGLLMLYLPALDALQDMRRELDRPMIINSAYRSPAHNHNEGGSKRSRHLAGAAFDIKCSPSRHSRLIAMAKAKGFNGFGRYRTFLHVDFRASPARWGIR